MTKAKKPYEDSELAKLLRRRILELKPVKSQIQIAAEIGYPTPNMITMVKNGSVRMPIDRAPGWAKALSLDPRLVLRLALEQDPESTSTRTVDEVLGVLVSKNEAAWVEAIRTFSGHTDPTLTSRLRARLHAVFER